MSAIETRFCSLCGACYAHEGQKPCYDSIDNEHIWGQQTTCNRDAESKAVENLIQIIADTAERKGITQTEAALEVTDGLFPTDQRDRVREMFTRHAVLGTSIIERDYGYAWSDNPQRFPRYRVTWNETSGELYALNFRTHEIETFCRIADRASIESLMEGWSDHIYDPCSLEWIRSRCSAMADELCGITGGDS